MNNQLSIHIPGVDVNSQGALVASYKEAMCDSASAMCTEATMHNRPARGDNKLSFEGGSGMTMQEVRFKYNKEIQIVFKFQGKLNLLVHECFDEGSEFYHRSKERLNQVFFLIESSEDVDVYRTNRGADLSDYTIYVNKGEWQVLDYFYTYTPARGSNQNAQHRMYTKYDEPSVKIPTIHAYPYAYDDEVVAFFSFDGQDMVYEKSYPRLRTNPEAWMPWHNYAMAIIRVMSTLVENDKLNEGIKELIIHNGQATYSVRKSWRVLLGKHDATPHGCIPYWDKRLEDEFNHLKARLQLRGITVSYKSSLPI